MKILIAGSVGMAALGLLAACSSNSSNSNSSTSTTPKPDAHSSTPATGAQAATAATVSVQSISGIPGQALVGSTGHPLYLFEADKNGMSACTGACAQAWPPDTVSGMAHASAGANRALLGTIKRSDGTTQLTYSAHPLYYFAGDTGTGAKGQGLTAFGGDWYVVSPSGSKIDTH